MTDFETFGKELIALKLPICKSPLKTFGMLCKLPAQTKSHKKHMAANVLIDWNILQLVAEVLICNLVVIFLIGLSKICENVK